jgi:hypothetical protein
MKKVVLYFTFLVLYSSLSHAQTSGIKLYVSDSATKQPLSISYIYIGNVSIITDSTGIAEKKPIVPGKYNVVIVHEGYDTLVISGVEVSRDVLNHLAAPLVKVKAGYVPKRKMVKYIHPIMTMSMQD